MAWRQYTSHWRRSDAFIVDFQHILLLILVFLWLTLGRHLLVRLLITWCNAYFHSLSVWFGNVLNMQKRKHTKKLRFKISLWKNYYIISKLMRSQLLWQFLATKRYTLEWKSFNIFWYFLKALSDGMDFKVKLKFSISNDRRSWVT